MPKPSKATLAARSLTAAMRLSGPAKSQALAEHFEKFAPPVRRSSACVLPRRALRDASGRPVFSTERQRPAKRALLEVVK